mmetsp:Transcript_4334/g.7393  ORF Transcript_4334/g.7393 Transcript_4334/m.7393 type:complete len:380 (-) Transcript_4334:38-1177(-)
MQCCWAVALGLLHACPLSTALVVQRAEHGSHRGQDTQPVTLVGNYAVTSFEIGGQNFTALIDTGSSAVAVASGQCDSEGCVGHRHFRPEDDAEGRFMGVEMSDLHISFATASLAGSGFATSVCLGTELCGNAAIIVAATESAQFQALPCDAVLGLGLPQQAPSPAFNVLSSLKKVKQRFELALKFGSTVQSYLSLGAGKSDFHGAWLNMLGLRDQWTVALQGFGVQGLQAHQPCGEHGCSALIDSGCPNIVLPAVVDSQLKKELHLDDCAPEAIASMPELTFKLADGHVYVVRPEHYVRLLDDGSSQRCSLAVVGTDDSANMAILGMPFLLGRSVLFDQENHRVAMSGGQLPPAKEATRAAASKGQAFQGALSSWLESL